MNKPSAWAFALLSVVVISRFAFAAPRLSHEDFNRLAAQEGLPFYWSASSTDSKMPQPGELLGVGSGVDLTRYVSGGRFTEALQRAYDRLVEARRLEAVRRELDQGRPHLLASDFRAAPAADRALVEHVAAASRIIDELYLEQRGGLRYKDAIPAPDAASRALFERNHGPWCEAPATEHDPFCSAVSTFPPKRSDAYPEALAGDPEMCETLRKRPDAKELLDPFTVVRDAGGKLAAVPLTAAYRDKMAQVARELRAAAAAQQKDEADLKAYLLGAAKGFETNDWSAADDAWAKMGSTDSKWYLRVAPDETEFDPCQEKAGFHVSFARIDQTSVAWKAKLAPRRQELENELAALIGPAYKARKVAFGLPDFIEIVLTAGDSRPGLGATSGQSLPNWGKVAQEGRRRTMAVTNLDDDPDAKRIKREKAAALLDPETMKHYPDDREPGLVGVILHEAAHNLGPHTDYLVDGKTPAEIFGGRLELVLEEMKAQTAALWYTAYALRKGMISEEQSRQIYTHEMGWCFGHIMDGMFTETGNPKPYSQLCAVQLGSFVKEGAIRFDGKFHIDYDRLPRSVEALMQKVARVRAAGDKAGAQALLDDFTTGPGAEYVHMAAIQERLMKFPKESYTYSVLY